MKVSILFTSFPDGSEKILGVYTSKVMAEAECDRLEAAEPQDRLEVPGYYVDTHVVIDDAATGFLITIGSESVASVVNGEGTVVVPAKAGHRIVFGGGTFSYVKY